MPSAARASVQASRALDVSLIRGGNHSAASVRARLSVVQAQGLSLKWETAGAATLKRAFNGDLMWCDVNNRVLSRTDLCNMLLEELFFDDKHRKTGSKL